MEFIALIFGICVLNAHCAVYENADKHLHREMRSPHYGGQNFFGPPPPGPPPPPPPPPFLYHTHNWSGVSRGYGGRTSGVFSGAAATAGSSQPTNGEALALATADTSSGQSENCDDAGSSNIGQIGSKSFESGSAQYGRQVKSSGRGFADSQSSGLQAGFVDSNSNSGAGSRLFVGSGDGRSMDFGGHSEKYKSHSSSFSSSSGDSGFSGNRQQNNGFNSQSSGIDSGVSGGNGGYQGAQPYKEAHFSEGHGSQSGAQQNNGGSFSHGGLSGGQQVGSQELGRAQSQRPSVANAGSIDSSQHSQGSGFSQLNAGLDGSNKGATAPQGQLYHAESGASSGSAYGNRGHGNSHYQSENDRSEQFQSGGSGRGQEKSSSDVSGGDYSAFNGALDLASQAADKAGCSTCQKGGYALSNAKSYNGNAISLAIGG